jgi:hypothetical protein
VLCALTELSELLRAEALNGDEAYTMQGYYCLHEEGDTSLLTNVRGCHAQIAWFNGQSSRMTQKQ